LDDLLKHFHQFFGEAKTRCFEKGVYRSVY